MIPSIVYGLCTITSAFCALLLLMQYQRTRLKLIFWTGICFVGFTLNNVLLVIDYILPPEIDLSVVRIIPALIGLMLMIWAIIQETI